jgi:hypothetical protein
MRMEYVLLDLLEPVLYGNGHRILFDRKHILMIGLVLHASASTWGRRRQVMRK